MNTNNERYARQIMLFGEEGQERLRKAKILLVGVGGLGSPIATYLVGAGIGTLGIIDDDVVSTSNLHRQVIYDEQAVGLPKPVSAKERLSKLNHEVNIITYCERLTRDNADVIIRNYDMVVDGCDNYDTRYLIDDVCRQLNKPYIYGSIQGYSGHVAVFGAGKTPQYYNDLFPKDFREGTKDKGNQHINKSVVGPTAAVVGSVEAMQVIHIVTQTGEPLINKLWIINLTTMKSSIIDL